MNNNELFEKFKIVNAISNFEMEYKNNKNKKRASLRKELCKSSVTITTIIGIIMGCTCVMATSYIVYEKIWKEPKSYTYEEYISNLEKSEVSDEEKEMLITEEAAKRKALEILEKLGYENQTINRIELKRGTSVDYYYIVKTNWEYEEGIMVQLDAKDGKFLSFRDMEDKHMQSEKLTNEEISEVAIEIYNKLELKNEEYKIYETKIQDYYFKNQRTQMLEAEFYKYYDGIKNNLEMLKISFAVVNNEILLNSIIINEDNSYQNNPVVITEEEAINIAKSKEQELSPLKITNVKSELSIEKMNTVIYEIENDKYVNINSAIENEIFYETENMIRKVWKVKIEHDAEVKDYGVDIGKYVKEGMNKFYYVDATTGEIIGGMHSFD